MTNYTRALFLSNTAEERALKRSTSFPIRFEFCHQRRDIAVIYSPFSLGAARGWELAGPESTSASQES